MGVYCLSKQGIKTIKYVIDIAFGYGINVRHEIIKFGE